MKGIERGQQDKRIAGDAVLDPGLAFGVTRRGFLRATGKAAAGMLGMWAGAKGFGTGKAEDVEEAVPEEAAKMKKINKLRQNLGLGELASGWKNNVSGTADWPRVETWPSADGLLTKQKPYLDLLEGCMSFLGARGRCLILGMKTNPIGGMRFDALERMFYTDEQMAENYQGGEVVGLFLHEAIGHGTDPNRLGNVRLPVTDLLEMLEGFYLAVGESFAVKGEFFNHKDDWTLRRVKWALGERLARRLYFDDYWGDESYAPIIKWLEREFVGKDVFFNKAICQKMGGLVLGDVTRLLGVKGFMSRGSSGLDEAVLREAGLVELYREEVEEQLGEIYAEMVRLVLEPEQKYVENNDLAQVRSNRNIVRGVRQVLGVVAENGQLDLHTVRGQIREAYLRWEAERGSEKSKQEINVNEENWRHKQKVDGLVKRWRQRGVIPKKPDFLSSEDYEKLQRYASIAWEIVKKPGLEGFLDNPEVFDYPKMHIWEIDELEAYLRLEYIRDLVGVLISENEIPEIEEYCDFMYQRAEYLIELAEKKGWLD